MTQPTRVNRAIAWISSAQAIVGVLDLVTMLLLLRFWVTSADYGIATAAASFLPILELATDLGIITAVIARDALDRRTLSTLFWLNLLMSCLLFAGLWWAAPRIAALHGHAVVGDLLLAFGAKLIFQNVYAIPTALMKRQLRFAELSTIRVIANLVEATVKLTTAALGEPVWCFALGTLSRYFVTGVGVQICHPWWPSLALAVREARGHVVFGLRATATQILYHAYTNLDYQVVGYYFGAAALGVYRLAYELILELVRTLSGILLEVALPVFARLRTDLAAIRERFLSFTRMNLVVVLPVVAFLLLAVEDVIVVAVGPDPAWAAAAPMARILAVVGLLRVLGLIAPPLLDGLGHPQLTLRYTALAALGVGGAFFVCASQLSHLGPLSVAVGWAAGYPLAFAFLVAMTLGLIGLRLRDYLRPLLSVIGCVAGAAAAAAPVAYFTAGALPPLPRLLCIAAAELAVLLPLYARIEGLTPSALRAALRK